METRTIPLTVIEVVDMLISGKEKMATEIVSEFLTYEKSQAEEGIVSA